MTTSVRNWLLGVIGLIFCMVVVGGITRLTGSGLSIVEWQPIMGAIPPLNEAQWLETFAKYQQTPQYRITNSGMSLHEFKGIFFWEYVHRLLGRTIGLAFALPLAWFWLRGQVAPHLRGKLLFALALGGLQGFVGWYMVRSGLVDEPRVSHFRLALHLGIALAIMAWLSWLVFSERTQAVGNAVQAWVLVRVITALAVVQIVYGAFVAGLHAGWGYNTFPKMGTQWIADAVMAMDPWWQNLVYSNATVQFVHRWLGTLLLLLCVVLRWRTGTLPTLRRGADILLALVALQYVLGVYTLLGVVPLVPAVAHQACAALIVLALTNLLETSRCRQPSA